MQRLDKRIAILRLRLAEIRAREDQLKSLQRQYEGQIDRIVEFAVQENSDLDAALSMIEEVDARRAQAGRASGQLEVIKARAQEELDALLLTRGIESAKAEIADLEVRRRQLDAEISRLRQSGNDASQQVTTGAPDASQLTRSAEDLDGEIRRLRQLISDASEAAARAVSRRGK